MAQKKRKKTAVRRKYNRNKPKVKTKLVTEDRASQEKLAQVVVDTVKDREARLAEIAQEGAKTEEESGFSGAGAAAPNKEQIDQILQYLEGEILPRARRSSFSGMVPLIENGQFVAKPVNSVEELEKVIADIKSAKTKFAVASLPSTNLPVQEVNSKSEAKRLGFLGKITSFFK